MITPRTASFIYSAIRTPFGRYGARLSMARRVPAGVVGVISPFNVPIILGIRSVAPALALGNAVILKPDPVPRSRAVSPSPEYSKKLACPRVCCKCSLAVLMPAKPW
jgi:Aldehyde dehydrogenase family